jgi:hypothetical protein
MSSAVESASAISSLDIDVSEEELRATFRTLR